MKSPLTFGKIQGDHRYQDGRYKNSLYVSGCEKDVTEVVIPQEVDGLKVKAIGFHGQSSPFYACNELVKVLIPDTIEHIAGDAFQNCSKLQSVQIPRNVKYIGGGAFRGCSSLKNIEVAPENSNFKIINGMLLSDYQTRMFFCPETPDVVFPRSLRDVDYRTASNLADARSVTLHKGLSGGPANFCKFKYLREIVFPWGAGFFDDYSLSGCSNLRSLTFYYATGAFEKGVLRGCPIEEVTVPATPHVLFAPTVKILEGETKIVDWLFTGSRVERVEIPSTVYSIARSAFYGCERLTEIIVAPENRHFFSDGGSLYCRKTNRLITKTKGKKSKN